MNPSFAPTSPAVVPLNSFGGNPVGSTLIISPRDPANGLPSGKRLHPPPHVRLLTTPKHAVRAGVPLLVSLYAQEPCGAGPVSRLAGHAVSMGAALDHRWHPALGRSNSW